MEKMSMSLKQELETWASALKSYDEGDYARSVELFDMIGESSKIQVNIGLIFATQGRHEDAVSAFRSATSYDQYLAVAYFQCGVSNFLMSRYEDAYKDFDDAILYLRGNQAIMYEQLGLKYILHSAEVLFNKGLCLIYLNQTEDGLSIMAEASREKATDEHAVIDEAIRDRGDGYTVFSIPIGVLYRPAETKLKNAKAKDYMGKAKLVASADSRDAYVSFVGSTRLAQGLSPSGAPLERASSMAVSEPAGLGRSMTVSEPSGLGRSRTVLEPPRIDGKSDVVRPAASIRRGASASAIPTSTATPPPPPAVRDERALPGLPTRGLSVRRTEGVGTPTASSPGGVMSPMSRSGSIKPQPAFPSQQSARMRPLGEEDELVFSGPDAKHQGHAAHVHGDHHTHDPHGHGDHYDPHAHGHGDPQDPHAHAHGDHRDPHAHAHGDPHDPHAHAHGDHHGPHDPHAHDPHAHAHGDPHDPHHGAHGHGDPHDPHHAAAHGHGDHHDPHDPHHAAHAHGDHHDPHAHDPHAHGHDGLHPDHGHGHADNSRLAPATSPAGPRFTAMYDDLLSSYRDSEVPDGQPMLPAGAMGANKKLAQWARGVSPPSAGGIPLPGSDPSTPALSRTSSSIAGSDVSMARSAGTIRRKITRRATTKGDRYVPMSYDGDEDDEIDFEEVFELVKIRVKLHYQDEIRGMAIGPELPFEDFVDRVTRKFDKAFNRLSMKFKDEDGIQVTLRDESDYDLAIETAREAAKGRPEGRLEVWCTDA